MRIRWVKHPHPAKQHLNGIIQHEPYEAVAPFLLSGACEEVPYKSTLDFLNDHEARRVAALPKSAAPATGWSIRESTSNDPRVRFVVTETSPLGEVTFYDAPPVHAPASVKQKFADAVATDAAAFSQRAEFLKRQNEHREPTELSRPYDIARTIIGANGVKRG
jgi:hypothetical protein